MQPLILEADESIMEQIKSFLSLIPKEKLKRSSLPVISQLGDLRVMRDYVVCEVYHDGKRFLFSQHFCFAETDVLD